MCVLYLVQITNGILAACLSTLDLNKWVIEASIYGENTNIIHQMRDEQRLNAFINFHSIYR